MVFCFYFTHNSQKNIFFIWIKEEKQQSQVGLMITILVAVAAAVVCECRWKGIYSNVQIIMIITNLYETHSVATFLQMFFFFFFIRNFWTFLFFFVVVVVATCSVYFIFFHSIHIDGSIAHTHQAILPVIRFLFAYC